MIPVATVETFYDAATAVSFTLLGLWWVVVQLKYQGGTGDPRRRRHAYGVALFFLVPGIISLVSTVNTGLGALWRLAFGIAAGVGLLEIVLNLASEGARTRAASLLRVVGAILYVLIIVVAAAPGVVEDVGIDLNARETEAILLALVLVVGVNIAWLALVEPPETAGA
jgi:hypothetical protein